MQKHNGAPAKATAKVRHEIKVIRADGSEEVAYDQHLSAEDSQRVWDMIKEHVVTEEEENG